METCAAHIRGCVVILLVAAGIVAWYASTPTFEKRVRRSVVSTLEQATGGRVELGAFRWRILHLELEADDLTIHGLEAQGEVPYAHVDRLLIRAKVISFFRAKIGLNLLQAEHPVIHLIVYPDGTTNQPKPKAVNNNGNPIKDTLFDLAVDRTQVDNGLALVNQRATPFDLSAKDLGLVVTYQASHDAYRADLKVSDLVAGRGKREPVHSTLTMRVDLRRNSANMSSLRLQTGPSILDANATLTNFNDPQWQLAANGKIDVREVEALTAIPGLREGIVDLQVKGQGNLAAFNVEGHAKVSKAGYHMSYLDVSGVDVTTRVRVTRDELSLPRFEARLAQGGTVDGEFHILHWLGLGESSPVAANGRATRAAGASHNAPEPSQGIIRVNVHGVTLDTLMQLLTPPRYQNLGFNTAATGPAKVDWVGNAADLTAEAQMTLAPSDRPRAGEAPLSGSLDAKYFNRNGSVAIAHLDAQTPATQIHVRGALGVYPENRESSLTADVTTSNLGEFDRTMVALGVSANGRQGVKAIPVELHGQAEFHGTVTGTLLKPDVSGHLLATNFETDFPAADITTALVSPKGGASVAPPPAPTASAAAPRKTIRWDRLDAQAEVSPLQITVREATLSRGTTSIHASGQVHAHELSRSRSAFDEFSPTRASVEVQNAVLDDVLTMTGVTLPVSGTLSLRADIGGLLGNLDGRGHLALLGGVAYGEPYRSLNADLTVKGREIGASNLTLLQNGGQLTGKGAFDLRTQRFQFEAQGRGFELAHFHRLQNQRVAVAGQLNFEAHGTGSIDDPHIQANLHLARIALGSQSVGHLDADAHTDHKTLFLIVNANLQSADVKATGQMQLSGDYLTQAHLSFANLDLDPLLKLANVQGLTAHSVLGGNATLSGPAREPRRMNGEVNLDQFSLAMAGVPLHSDGAIHAVLDDGTLRLDPLHIEGDDTNLRAQGSVQVFDPDHEMDMKASGSVNLKVAESFNPNVTSSGHVDFTLDAEGTITKPDLGGEVKFTNVALSLLDMPNGLSQMNGTLVFDQDRLDVKDLTAMTGGGQLKIGGSITYQQGLYGDLTATGKDIRIRYPQGISSMADAKLRLQGSPTNMTLSGNVVLTRFAINPNLDFAALTSTSGGVSAPPDPNAPSSHLRLDVHITSAPELNFQNSYAKLAGDVDLRVRGTIAQPSVLGHISVTEGSATFAGTQYQLQHGDIFFTNPVNIEPVIDLDATAHVEEYDLTIGLHGTTSKLNFTYRSEPPLPQADIFALLALGRTQEEQQIYSQQQQQAGVNSTADTLLGGALNATVSSRIQRLFGGGSVKIDPTFVGTLGSSTARITVEQRISRNATLTYATNVNSTAQQLIQGQFDLTRNVSLVAVRDESGVFSLVVKVHKRVR